MSDEVKRLAVPGWNTITFLRNEDAALLQAVVSAARDHAHLIPNEIEILGICELCPALSAIDARLAEKERAT